MKPGRSVRGSLARPISGLPRGGSQAGVPDSGSYLGGRIRSSPTEMGFLHGSREAAHAEFLSRHVAEIQKLLEGAYESPTHGNKRDPVGELVYIMLSRRTREAAYSEAYSRVRDRYSTWRRAAKAPQGEFRGLVAAAGLAGRRSAAIQEAISKLVADLGPRPGSAIRQMSERRAFETLARLPEVGPKSALCVLMYSLGKEVFPVDTHVARICGRVGFVPERTGHKRAQVLLARIFPPRLRKSLHVTMVALGRRVCTSREPKCQECPLSNFCAYNRKRLASQAATHPLRVNGTFVDLFSGCGGLSTGLEGAGFRPLLSCDSSRLATDTYYLNHPTIDPMSVICRDARRFAPGELLRLAGESPDILAGGPPCQGFSMVGRRGRRGHKGGYVPVRNRLYQEFIRASRELSPRFLIMENVPHMRAFKRGRFINQALGEFSGAGYIVRDVRLHAEAFGVPQTRRRLVLLGVRADLPDAATILTDWVARLELADSSTGARVTLEEAIGDLPRLGPGGGGSFVRRSVTRDPSSYAKELGAGGRGTFNHLARGHMPRDVALFRLLKPGEWARDVIYKYKRPDLMPYVRKAPDGSPILGPDGLPVLDSFRDKFRKLVPWEPSPTVMAHMGRDANMYIHPSQSRALTVREAARIQSFRDDYVFLGELGQQFVMVGNAVPPFLGRGVAFALLGVLRNAPSLGPISWAPSTKAMVPTLQASEPFPAAAGA